MNANKEHNFEVEEPTTGKHFRPWEVHTEQNENTARPNIVEAPPATDFDYWSQQVTRLEPWLKQYIIYCFLVAAYSATDASTPDDPEPLTVNTPTMKTTAPRRKRKREEEDEDEEIHLKAKRDEHLMKRISKFSREQIEEVFPYRPEMARKYPPKERTPAEQRRRDKNTEACRRSRRRKKLMGIMKEYAGACEM